MRGGPKGRGAEVEECDGPDEVEAKGGERPAEKVECAKCTVQKALANLHNSLIITRSRYSAFFDITEG